MTHDSFGGKLLLNVIDKLLIGVAGALLVMYFQSSQRQAEIVSQERLAVGRVVTEVLSDQRSRLMNDVSNYVTLVKGLQVSGSARDENAVELSRLEQEIRRSIAVLRTIDATRRLATCEPRDTTVLDDFETLLSTELTIPLLADGLEPTVLQARLDKVLPAYTNVLDFTRCLAVDTVQYEVVRTTGRRGAQ